jgi:hypothetical protein
MSDAGRKAERRRDHLQPRQEAFQRSLRQFKLSTVGSRYIDDHSACTCLAHTEVSGECQSGRTLQEIPVSWIGRVVRIPGCSSELIVMRLDEKESCAAI